MYKYALCCCALLIFLKAGAQNYPFPQHVNYTAGTIKPSNHNQLQMEDAVRNFYTQWKNRYVRNDCGTNQYYVWDDEGGSPSDTIICVSEGQGYGFMIIALMGGYDPDARNIFDGLFRFCKAHPSMIDQTLMDWSIRSDCAGDTASGIDAATDGDLDMAYGLLLADKQWGSAGIINYRQEAENYIHAIYQSESNILLNFPLLGDWVLPSSAEYNATRPSDFIPDHFRIYAQVTGQPSWNSMVDRCYTLIDSMQTYYSQTTGLIPDFIEHINTSAKPAHPNFLEGPNDGSYYYNACRVPWRLATDYLMNGDVRAYDAIQKINTFIRNETSEDASHIRAGYKLNGTHIAGGNYQASSFIGPFAVGAMVDPVNQSWLNDCYDLLLNQNLNDNHYYDNTLKLLCMLTISGTYWKPEYPNALPTIPASKDAALAIVPNPIEHSGFNMIFDAKERGDYSITLSDQTGRMVSVQHRKLPAGVQYIQFPDPEIPSGMYLVTLAHRGSPDIFAKLLVR